MISVIIPAHNEDTVIERCLRTLLAGARTGEMDIVVVANGCRDATAARVRAVGSPDVRVIETEIGSKTHALNLGDEAARGFPRVYLDADVQLSGASVRRIAEVMATDGLLAAAPTPSTEFVPGTSWVVRAYYMFWMALPYVQEGLVAAGVYALSEEGRKRFQNFPNVINDDLFVRMHFRSCERVEVKGAVSKVTAPTRFWDLVKIKSRGRLGAYQLWRQYPELSWQEAKGKNYSRALMTLLWQPRLWLSALPYVLVNALSVWRAMVQFRRLGQYMWERDNSSRIAADVEPRPAPTGPVTDKYVVR
jgi:glycosyltransferase involved in cell wall biosynthesis